MGAPWREKQVLIVIIIINVITIVNVIITIIITIILVINECQWHCHQHLDPKEGHHPGSRLSLMLVLPSGQSSQCPCQVLMSTMWIILVSIQLKCIYIEQLYVFRLPLLYLYFQYLNNCFQATFAAPLVGSGSSMYLEPLVLSGNYNHCLNGQWLMSGI